MKSINALCCLLSCLLLCGCSSNSTLVSTTTTTTASTTTTTKATMYAWDDPIWKDPCIITASGETIYYRFTAAYLEVDLDRTHRYTKKGLTAVHSLEGWLHGNTIAKVKLNSLSISEDVKGYMALDITVEQYYSINNDWSLPEELSFTVYENMGPGLNLSRGDGIVGIPLGTTKALLEGNSYYVRLYNDQDETPILQTIQDAEHLYPWESPLITACGESVQVYGMPSHHIIKIEEIDFSKLCSAAQVQLYIRYTLQNEELYQTIKDLTEISTAEAKQIFDNSGEQMQ